MPHDDEAARIQAKARASGWHTARDSQRLSVHSMLDARAVHEKRSGAIENHEMIRERSASDQAIRPVRFYHPVCVVERK